MPDLRDPVLCSRGGLTMGGTPGSGNAPWRAGPGGLEIRVRVTPRGGRDGIEGVGVLSDGSSVLKVRVRAAPEDGAANEAVRRVFAGALGCPASAVTLAAGATARIKTLRIAGDPATWSEALEALALKAA